MSSRKIVETFLNIFSRTDRTAMSMRSTFHRCIPLVTEFASPSKFAITASSEIFWIPSDSLRRDLWMSGRKIIETLPNFFTSAERAVCRIGACPICNRCIPLMPEFASPSKFAITASSDLSRIPTNRLRCDPRVGMQQVVETFLNILARTNRAVFATHSTFDDCVPVMAEIASPSKFAMTPRPYFLGIPADCLCSNVGI